MTLIASPVSVGGRGLATSNCFFGKLTRLYLKHHQSSTSINKYLLLAEYYFTLKKMNLETSLIRSNLTILSALRTVFHGHSQFFLSCRDSFAAMEDFFPGPEQIPKLMIAKVFYIPYGHLPLYFDLSLHHF